MNYKGVIIEESLTDSRILKEFLILQKEVEHITEAENTPWLDKWSMYTVSIPEKDIDIYTKRLSELIDTTHCSDWYCDFRNDQFHYIVFANKVFKLDRKKKEDYIEMQNYAEKLGLPKYQLPSFNDLPLSLLRGFLIEAKKQTYANIDEPKITSSRLGSHDYHYEEEIEGVIMKYHDTYFGGLRFMGEEVVYRGENIPKWGMNYYGITLDENLSEETMDKVLRPALMKVGEDRLVLPVRGPSYLQIDDYVYTFQTTGDIDDFSGVEEIYQNQKLIYRFQCHGGIIE